MPTDDVSVVVIVLGPVILLTLTGALVWWLKARAGRDKNAGG